MSWQQANQRYLMASLTRVRHALCRAIGQPTESQADLEAAVAAAEAVMSAPAALQQLCALFQLSPFERDVLLLCAGPELDSDFARLCAEAQGDLRRTCPTFGLALASLPDANWNAVVPTAPLRYWRLIEVGTGELLNSSPLRVDERVLHFLAGTQYLDERLEGLLRPLPPSTELPPSQGETIERIARLIARSTGPLPVIALCGSDRAALQSIAAQVGTRFSLGLYTLRAADLPQPVLERGALVRLWEREALLTSSALFMEVDEADNLRAVNTFVERLMSPLFIASRETLMLPQLRPVVRVNVEQPTATEQQDSWHQSLGPHGAELNGYVPTLVTQFNLSAPMIQAACTDALAQLSPESSHSELKSRLWEACRVQARTRLDDLAQRIETHAMWDDLVLPDQQREMLLEIVAHVRQRHTVYETWGFAARSSRGLGTSVIFAGPSGTGKTLAAEVLANTLHLDLYRVELSSVVSKYIGETERNLRRVFDAAEYGGAILLFDEADALFGKRSEVKDSHDRYANIEVSFLLQQMESYRGLAILTTNMLNAFDSAFLRRVRFTVQFPFPTAEQRAAIWARIFPLSTPTAGLDLNKLARLNVTGGNICNIALNAAFLAADAAGPVRMAHLLRAATSEYAKLEKPLTEAEIEDWVE